VREVIIANANAISSDELLGRIPKIPAAEDWLIREFKKELPNRLFGQLFF